MDIRDLLCFQILNLIHLVWPLGFCIQVEAKKAVPREDQLLLNRGPNCIPGFPSPGRTKKIFVGGLASNVSKSDFKKYFDQFGTIIDVVVMYDHSTKRPRGFGFITYDSEDAVDRVLIKAFHHLNGKMVEVKRAVPKELSPSPSWSPMIECNYSLGSNRVNNILNSYAPVYSMASVGGYKVCTDGGLSPIATVRGGASPFNGSGCRMEINLDQDRGPSLTSCSNLVNTLGYGRVNGSFYNGSSGRFNSVIGYQGENRRSNLGLSPNFQALWGSGGLSNNASSIDLSAHLGTESGSFGVSFGKTGSNWSPSPIHSTQGGGTSSSYMTGNAGFGSGEGNTFGFQGDGKGNRSSGSLLGLSSSYSRTSSNFEESYSELHQGSSGYGGSNWLSTAPDGNTLGSFSYGLSTIDSDGGSRNLERIAGNYSGIRRES